MTIRKDLKIMADLLEYARALMVILMPIFITVRLYDLILERKFKLFKISFIVLCCTLLTIAYIYSTPSQIIKSLGFQAVIALIVIAFFIVRKILGHRV